MIKLADRSISRQNKVNFCLISVKNRDEWIQGIISYIDTAARNINVFLSDEHLQKYFSAGDKVVIKSLGNRNEFQFSGSVRKIASSVYKKALIIKIDDIREYIDYRKDERYYVKFDAFIITSEGKKSRANILDISLGGVSVVSDGHFMENETVNVEILSDPENPIMFVGKIIRRKKNKRVFKYGIMIEDMEESSEKLLDVLVKLLRARKTALEHSWKVFKRIRLLLYPASALLVFFLVFVYLASKGM